MSEILSLKITGNPFVDAGIFALKTKLNKNIDEITIDDLKNESSTIAGIYTKEAWKNNMHSIFPNSVLVNNSVKGDREELYYKSLNELIESITPIDDFGSCMACGRRNVTETSSRNRIPLTGSGKLKNYFSFANEGADYCSLCIFLIQFSPLIMYGSGGKFILLHSNSEKVMKFWSKSAIKNIKMQIALGDYTGCFNESIKNPTNAIFEMISKVISSSDYWEGENPSINFYYFTNYNPRPELEIFTLPTNVFNFLADIPQDELSNWNIIVRHQYILNWNKKKDRENFKNKYNRVYDSLLKRKSILRFFFNFEYKKTYCSWVLVKKYLKEVRHMDEERIETIKDVGDKLSEYIKLNDSKKSLSNLESASNYNSFRNVLRKILKNKINSNDGDLLFTFDDYVNYLFPEGNLSWRETQDLLLFRIYENLHEWMVEKDYVKEYEDETIVEEE